MENKKDNSPNINNNIIKNNINNGNINENNQNNGNNVNNNSLLSNQMSFISDNYYTKAEMDEKFKEIDERLKKLEEKMVDKTYFEQKFAELFNLIHINQNLNNSNI